MLQQAVKKSLLEGAFIPAHPLALNEDKTLDEVSQRALTNYYIEAGGKRHCSRGTYYAI